MNRSGNNFFFTIQLKKILMHLLPIQSNINHPINNTHCLLQCRVANEKSKQRSGVSCIGNSSSRSSSIYWESWWSGETIGDRSIGETRWRRGGAPRSHLGRIRSKVVEPVRVQYRMSRYRQGHQLRVLCSGRFSSKKAWHKDQGNENK